MYRRKPSTPADKLVLSIKCIATAATDRGILNQKNAIDAYVGFMKSHGHDVIVSSSGFHISSSHPFLEASPDGVVFDLLPINLMDFQKLSALLCSKQNTRRCLLVEWMCLYSAKKVMENQS